MPIQRGPIQPIRKYWEAFVSIKQGEHELIRDKVTVIEKPLWQFTKEYVEVLDDELNADIIYVPHHCKKTMTFNNVAQHHVHYYMQMCLPWLFQVDREGWCSDASVYPILPCMDTSKELIEELRSRQLSGASKFPQPARDSELHPTGYMLYACQLPHDQTIKYHSDWSVEESLRRTITWAIDRKVNLVIKPHPINPASQVPLHEIYKEYEPSEYIVWVDNKNINDLLVNCSALISVNSGVGMEAIIHGKPVFNWGRADYDSVSWTVYDFESFDNAWESRTAKLEDYPAFINAYHNHMVQVRPLNNLFD